MIETAQKSIQRFRSRGVLIDSNLLLLYLIGSIDRKLIRSFKRTSAYRPEEFDLLVTLLQPVRTLMTTPHVATEVDNLAGQHPNPDVTLQCRAMMKLYVNRVKESHLGAKKLCESRAYTLLGLADAANRHIGRRKLVITDDFELAAYIERKGGNVINFTNLRAYV